MTKNGGTGIDSDAALTKHEQILAAIEQLEVGSKISVRAIAKSLGVSEGTAYKAIKEAEASGIVSTRERIGTVRIEKRSRGNSIQLTFREVAEMVEGRVHGGENGLDKTLNKFAIGAMELDAMLRYIDEGSLLIVGNRENAHRVALEQGAGVLVTGGFAPGEEMKRLADELELPIIVSRYDTFTVASMINRAMYDRLIKRKIMLVEDIVAMSKPAQVLRPTDTAADYHRLASDSGIFRFPVIDERGRVIGMMASKDAVGSSDDQTVDKLMTRHPITIAPNIAVISAAHTMANEGIDLLPVVDRHRKLLGVVSRKDVLDAMRYAGKHRETGQTFDDLMWEGFVQEEVEEGVDQYEYRYTGKIMPQMSGPLGTVSEGVLSALMIEAARRFVRIVGKHDYVIESLTTYFMRPVQIDSDISITPRALEIGRKLSKVEVEVADSRGLAAKAMLTVQTIEP
ncbi:putative transcriptional regulator [Paenibacillus cellulosilyticus]|uniref:Putative transcriptional regulator n=1 Tax=Paenibacillus cellulosilyticus TaxID=375489 RepID=A0A2V2YE53_9BACL|nr:DRTGG domain-containing protein [Paenibacillus cellulosilyticus]PWV90561.1 putative transcriptional regulator [Paenibacillus cellulosilyticus]QKS46766.1 CBS domain-containing protein [Paenibacillus cellulosilyticus]